MQIKSPEAVGYSRLPDVPTLSAEWQRAFSWIERELGGRVVRAERQARWRPAWFLDLERGDETLPLYFRGERGETDHGVYTLEHEMRVLEVLERHQIPVPHVYAFCPEPRGILMERSPGRANLATADDDAEREAVLDHYMELLARMHRIDVAAFEAVGLARPDGPQELGLCDFNTWERSYRKQKRRPEPVIEFVSRWVRRNVPRDRSRVSFICCDAGQFLFERGRVTAVLDLELACLGDPAADLGGMRGRDLSEPLGDLSRAIRKYEEFAGEKIDRSVVDFHAVRFGIVTPMATAHLVADPPPAIDLVQYLAWYLVWSRTPLEVIADMQSFELEPPALPEEEDVELALAERGTRNFEAYTADTAARLAIYRERSESLGPALAADDLDDAARLLGRRPATAAAADAALESLVAEAGPERDAELVSYFHRRLLRQEAILRPVMRELRDARMQRIR